MDLSLTFVVTLSQHPPIYQSVNSGRRRRSGVPRATECCASGAASRPYGVNPSGAVVEGLKSGDQPGPSGAPPALNAANDRADRFRIAGKTNKLVEQLSARN